MVCLKQYEVDGHTVMSTGNDLTCDCDFQGDCDHIISVLNSLKKSEFGLGFKIMKRENLIFASIATRQT